MIGAFSFVENTAMAKIERFEDLQCWQKARLLRKLVHQMCSKGELARDFETRSQIKGAALSAMSNIAEGFGRRSVKEFIRFLDVAQSSAIEVKSITYAIEDMEVVEISTLEIVRSHAEECKALILGLIRYLDRKQKGGKPDPNS